MSNPGSWVSSRNSQYNPYCFRAYDSGGTTLTDSGTVKINYATENYDYNNNFSGSTYTAPVAGVYHFDAGVGSTALTSPVSAAIYIYKNGATAINSVAYVPIASGIFVTVGGDLLLAAGDTIEVYAFQNTAGNETTLTTADTTWFSGHLVHRTA